MTNTSLTLFQFLVQRFETARRLGARKPLAAIQGYIAPGDHLAVDMSIAHWPEIRAISRNEIRVKVILSDNDKEYPALYRVRQTDKGFNITCDKSFPGVENVVTWLSDKLSQTEFDHPE